MDKRVLNSLKRVPFHYMRLYSNLDLMPQTGTGKKPNACKIMRGNYMRQTRLPCCSRKEAGLKIFIISFSKNEQKVYQKQPYSLFYLDIFNQYESCPKRL